MHLIFFHQHIPSLSTQSFPQILSLPSMAPPSPSLLPSNTRLLFNVMKTVLISSFIITPHKLIQKCPCMYKCRQESHQLLFHCIIITNADKNHVCLFVCSKGIPTTSPLHYCSGTTTGIQLTTLQHPFTAIFSSRSGRND